MNSRSPWEKVMSHKTLFFMQKSNTYVCVYLYLYLYICWVYIASFSRSITNRFFSWYLYTYISFWGFTCTFQSLADPSTWNLPLWLAALSPSAAWKQSGERNQNCCLSTSAEASKWSPAMLQHTWYSQPRGRRNKAYALGPLWREA